MREGITAKSPDGLSRSAQLTVISAEVAVRRGDQQARWRELRVAIAKVGIVLVDGADVKKSDGYRSWTTAT